MDGHAEARASDNPRDGEDERRSHPSIVSQSNHGPASAKHTSDEWADTGSIAPRLCLTLKLIARLGNAPD